MLVKILLLLVSVICFNGCNPAQNDPTYTNEEQIHIDTMSRRKIDSLMKVWNGECQFQSEVNTPYLFDSIYKQRINEIQHAL